MDLKKGLDTIIALAIASLIIYISFDVVWFLYVAVGFLAISIVSNKLTIIIGEIWFSFSHYLGLVMNSIIMFFIFYVILTPLAFFQRLSGKNQILKKENDNTYFHERNHLYTKNDIEKPW